MTTSRLTMSGSLDFLCDYIVNTHHSYVRKNLPDILTYTHKVLRAHGENHPELEKVHHLVESINAELTAHMQKEEEILFPYVKQLVAAKAGSQKFTGSPFGTVRNPITMMEMEHVSTGNYFDELRKCTNEYSLPEDACASYSLLYRMLAEFEEDLHLHFHLENHILFPKALDMEKSFVKN